MTTNKEADSELEEAIKKYLMAQGHDEGLLFDWFLITAQHIVLDEGSATALGHYQPSNTPIYQTAGLLRYATRLVDTILVNSED
jgi:hypothetical protein